MAGGPVAARTAAAFLAACHAELDAPKPGNVHRWAAGHGMSCELFERSARVAAPHIARTGARVGPRVAAAVTATHAAVGTNTNLGILLLAAPLARAAEAHPEMPLGEAVQCVLDDLDREDARAVFAAIRLANPGGLGSSPRHDVRDEPRATLLEAMAEAAARDRIAWNYAHGFADIVRTGPQRLRGLAARGWDDAWALTGVYLGFAAELPDSHVARKFGPATALEVQALLAPLRDALEAAADPADLLPRLLACDADLKRRGINPGTSADLTVATHLAAGMGA